MFWGTSFAFCLSFLLFLRFWSIFGIFILGILISHFFAQYWFCFWNFLILIFDHWSNWFTFRNLFNLGWLLLKQTEIKFHWSRTLTRWQFSKEIHQTSLWLLLVVIYRLLQFAHFSLSRFSSLFLLLFQWWWIWEILFKIVYLLNHSWGCSLLKHLNYVFRFGSITTKRNIGLTQFDIFLNWRLLFTWNNLFFFFFNFKLLFLGFDRF